MHEIGKVIAINGHMAKIQIKRVSACGESCASCKGGCTPTNTYVEAANDIEASVGQDVKIEMQTNVVFSAILLNYGLPLIMLIIGIFGGSSLTEAMKLSISKDIAAVLLGLALMAISYIVVHQIDKSYKKSGKVNFKIIKILD